MSMHLQPRLLQALPSGYVDMFLVCRTISVYEERCALIEATRRGGYHCYQQRCRKHYMVTFHY